MDDACNKSSVYVAPEVVEVDALHPSVREPAFRTQPIRAQLAQQADVLLDAHGRGDQRLRMQVMCWWPGARNRTVEEVMAGPFSRDDARATIALEYGFQSWAVVEDLGDITLSETFELALDDMLAGNHEAFEVRLADTPSLVTAQSAFGHRATLLHYLGANGVESHRQRTPLNAVQMATTLIARGADREAEAHVYGGGQTALALATTSAHPHNAGVAAALNAVLGNTS